MLYRLIAIAIGGAFSLVVNAQQGNPFEADAGAIRAGGYAYAGSCAACHGADAKGTPGPNLTVLWASGKNDAHVFETIRNGIEGSIMPPSAASDKEIWAIVAYLRSIGTVPPFASERGDETQGREIFASTCARCHRVDGHGGILGPDLSRIAMVRSHEALVHAIREPSASVDRAYRTVTLVTKGGERIRGVVKNEDVFSIQIVDESEELKAYLKLDLDRVEYESQSLMPTHRSNGLGRRELDDLLAFLATLRGDDAGL